MPSESLNCALLVLVALVVSSTAAASTLPPVLAANGPLSCCAAAEALPAVEFSEAFDTDPSIVELSDSVSPLSSLPGDTRGAEVLPPDSDAGDGSGLTICVFAVLAFGSLMKAVTSSAFRKFLTGLYYPESY